MQKNSVVSLLVLVIGVALGVFAAQWVPRLLNKADSTGRRNTPYFLEVAI